MESMVDRVRDVLSECVLHSTTSDVGVLDRIVVSLSQCSVDIGDLLNDSVVNGGDEEPSIELRQLHICVNELLVEWETKLFRHENRMGVASNVSLGRPRNIINVPLVSNCL